MSKKQRHQSKPVDPMIASAQGCDRFNPAVARLSGAHDRCLSEHPELAHALAAASMAHALASAGSVVIKRAETRRPAVRVSP